MKTYPYFTLLLLFRAGEHEMALEYCSKSTLAEVRAFGEDIYMKWFFTFECNLPYHEIRNFKAKADHPVLDICRDALVSLMAGVKFSSPFEEKFFLWFMENELDG